MKTQSPAVPTAKIVRIDGYELSCPLPERIGNSRGFFESRGALLVSITTDAGVTGWGETWAYPGAAAAIVRRDLAPKLIGQDAAAPRRLHDLMLRALPERHGVPLMAVSALDIGVWDAAARAANKPLSALLGGAMRERMEAYVSGPFLKPGADPFHTYMADLDTYLDAGFRAVKLRLGTTPKRDAEIARQVRARIGADMPLMVDLNQGFTIGPASDLATRLAEHDVRWLEEPIAHDNLVGYKRLADGGTIPLAAGESLFGVEAFRDAVASGALTYLQPDMALCGGVTEMIKIAGLAEAFGLALVPHVWGTAVNFNATLQFAATLPARGGHAMPCPMFEYDYSYNPLRTKFSANPVDANGTVAVSDAPGIGVDIDPAKFDSLLVQHWTVQ